MAAKRTKLEPTKRASKDLRDYARRAKKMRDGLAAQGRRFYESADIIRKNRDSRT